MKRNSETFTFLLIFLFSGNFSFPLNFSLGWNLRCDLHLALPTPLMGNSLNSNEMDQMIREQRWDEIILITKKGKYLHIFQIINYEIKRRWSFYEAVSDQGPVWVQREAIFQGSCKAFLNGQICSNYYNMMYWERILQKNHLITCFRRFYQRPYHLAAQMPMLGWVDVGKLIKVANIHSGFYVCYTN